MQNPRKTVVRAFRLDASLLERLQVVSQRHRLSENAFVGSLIDRRLKIDPLIQAFDHVSLGKETFASILGKVAAEDLECIGFSDGKRSYSLAKELLESGDVDVTFRQYVTEILGEQARWFRAETGFARPERMTLQHGYGMRWSMFLKGFLSGAFEAVSHDKAQITATDDFVRFCFPGRVPR